MDVPSDLKKPNYKQMKKIRPIAIYLPQFHPIPENDKAWGKGFTEWNNVVKAKPRYKGHYQPHLPADLGYYDLRLHEIREQQVKLAKEHGIFGFCYYHYWFNGKRILERPFQEVFESGKPDFPFMLCWANENWTRAWDGSEKEILLRQDYSEDDDRIHIRSLLEYFKDPRYIKVNNKPVFIIYKPDLFPNISKTLSIFREEAKKEGIELYLCQFERWIDKDVRFPNEKGFDAGIEFQPLSRNLQKYLSEKEKSKIHFAQSLIRKIVLKLFYNYFKNRKLNSKIIDFKDFIEYDLNHNNEQYKCYPGVSPSWDNTSRRKNQEALIFNNANPSLFRNWYENKCEKFIPYSDDENFIFINAWNEWAEGNHMEPCEKWGLGFLEAIKNGKC